MSDNEAVSAEGAVSGMSAAEVKFLVTCLQNATGGSISIDNSKVAEALNFKNPRSVANKLALLKKKFDLPLGSSGKGSGTPDKTAAKAPAVPKTPTKARVAKPRANSSTKKKVSPKKSEAELGDEDENGDEELKIESDEAADDENEQAFESHESEAEQA